MLRQRPSGADITVPATLCRSLQETCWPWEITFDAGGKSTNDYDTAGAGAALWHMRSKGAPICIARAYIALPPGTSAQVAEAQGCRIGVGMLLKGVKERRARVVGDTLGAIRYGATTQRFRALRMQGLVENT
eukprot:2140890-Pyramimonas_sp.AAC.1